MKCLCYNQYGDTMIAKLFFASLPAFIFIILFSLLDKKFVKKRWLQLLLVLVIGAIGSYICYRFEMHFGSYFKKVKDSTYLEVLFYAIFGVAIFEEGYKWLISSGATILDKKVKPLQVLVYTVFASIGFAWFENIVYYALKYNLMGTISRMFTAFPNHICNAIWMGYFLILFSKSKGKKKYLYLILSLVVATLIHGLYNSFLYGGDPKLMEYNLIYIGIVYSFTILLFVKIKKEFK